MTNSSLQNEHYGTFSAEWVDYLAKQKPGVLEMMGNLSVTETRAMSVAFTATNVNPFGGLEFEDHSIGIEGVTVRVFRPVKGVESVRGKEGRRPLAVVMHGGGMFMINAISFRDGVLEVMRLNVARENASRFSADPETIILAGASSGANLVAAVTQRALQNSIAGIRGQILTIPALCHPRHFPADKYELHSYESLENVPMMPAKRMEGFWNAYYSGQETNAEVSPLLAESHKGLPPTIMQVAGADVLRDEGIAYAKALENSGVKVHLKVYQGMPHLFGSDMVGFEAGRTAKDELVELVPQMMLGS
ncbi:MAG: hypothetical protein M1812_001780 [Candelaria pacifica]|nr:MAG: hypothetical protein M1812_001780 [Candelaria pacifica]